MQTIGLIGGMSWESSAVYYRDLNLGVQERLGGLSSPKVVLSTVDFAELTDLEEHERWDQIGELLAEAGRGVERAGADFLLLCTTTFHKVADAVADAVDIPLLHLGDVVAEACKQAGHSTVGLIGTTVAMDQLHQLDARVLHGPHRDLPRLGALAFAVERHVLLLVPRERALVHEHVVHYREQPCAKIASRSPQPPLLPCARKRFLHEIVGARRVARQHARIPAQARQRSQEIGLRQRRVLRASRSFHVQRAIVANKPVRVYSPIHRTRNSVARPRKMKNPPESVTAVISTDEPTRRIAAEAQHRHRDQHAHRRGEHEVERHREDHHEAERQSR